VKQQKSEPVTQQAWVEIREKKAMAQSQDTDTFLLFFFTLKLWILSIGTKANGQQLPVISKTQRPRCTQTRRRLGNTFLEF